MAPELDSVVVADPPEAWEAGGFTVDDDGVVRIGAVRVRLVGREAGKRIVSWSLRGVDAGAAIDGLATESSAAPPCAPADHPNGAVLVDHLVVMSPDVGRTVAALEAAGIVALRTREVGPEQYGLPVVQTFFRLGEVILELIGPQEPQGDGPAAFFGLAHTVTDLDAAQRLLGDALPRIKDAVQPGRRIATLRHKEVGMSVATAFMSP